MTLQALLLQSPYLATVGDTISLSTNILPLVVRADTNTVSITVTVGTVDITYTDFTPSSGYNIFSMAHPVAIASNPTEVKLVGNDVLGTSHTPPLLLLYTYAQTAGIPANAPPSGVSVYKGLNSCKVEWVRPDQLINLTNNLLGVRVLFSTDPTGVTVPYQQFGTSLVSAVSRTGQSVVDSVTSNSGPVAETVSLVTGSLTFSSSNNSITRTDGDWITDGATVNSKLDLTGFLVSNLNNNKTFTISGVFDKTIQVEEFVSDHVADTGTVLLYEFISLSTSVTQDEIWPINYSNAVFQTSLTSTTADQQFYVVLSSVVQNINDNHIYESNYSGPFTCGFVDLRQVKPTDFPYVQTKEAIATRLINATTLDYPDLDLSPRSELRDVLIDPVAIEIANQSVREWFARISSSISALATFDDYNGDGFSDSFTESPWKSMVANAWNLSSTDFQTFVNKQFDILGERAGVTRGSAQSAIAQVTFYTYIKPTATVTIDTTAIVGSLGDSQNPALNFDCRGAQTIDAGSLDHLYDPTNNWWAVTLPCECESTGSAGNIGSRTIVTAISGVPANWLVTNLTPADYGTDGESNAKFAERIKNRLVIGIDSGRRLGYWNTAMTTPGIVNASVVSSGDVEMLRDWYPQANRHLYGCVDVYVKGTQQSTQTKQVPYAYSTVKSIATLYASKTGIFTIAAPYPLANLLSLRATKLSGTVYLGVKKALISGTNVVLDPNELTSTGVTNSVFLSNKNNYGTGVTFSADAKVISPFQYTPDHAKDATSYQPVSDIYSIVGSSVGLVDADYYRLIIHDDPLLTGFSDHAANKIQVDGTQTAVVTTVVTFTPGNDTQLINSGIVLSGTNDVISVRSSDESTVYVNGVDYTIVGVTPYGAGYGYNSYAIQRTVTGGLVDVVNPVSVSVTYYQYILPELCTQHLSESVQASSSTPTYLSYSGIVQDTQTIDSYGYPALTDITKLWSNDVDLENITYNNRYLKVIYNGQVLVMNDSYTLTVDPITKRASILLLTGGSVVFNTTTSTLDVSYFTNEIFTTITGYPGYIAQVANAIEIMRHAAADVVVKGMIKNPVDITMTVELSPAAAVQALDSSIRTAIGVALDNAQGRLTQSEIIRQIKSIAGVTNIQIPLTRFAKGDGAYIVGQVLPVGTAWTAIPTLPYFSNYALPASAFITSSPVLTDSTLPSGGLTDAFAGLLYEGDSYTRCLSLQELVAKSSSLHASGSKATAGNFYIFGANDPADPSGLYAGCVAVDFSTYFSTSVTQGGMSAFSPFSPTYLAFRVTYEVWNETGFKDLVLSPTEYLTSGIITIDYITPQA